MTDYPGTARAQGITLLRASGLFGAIIDLYSPWRFHSTENP